MPDAEQDETAAEPATKKDLYRFFSGKGPNKMVLAFLQDRGLQLAAMVIVRVSEPVEHSYALDLKMMEGRCLFTVPSC